MLNYTKSFLISLKSSYSVSKELFKKLQLFKLSRTTSNKRRYHHRGGKIKTTCLFWNVHGRNQLIDLLATDNFLNRFSASFLCETWISEPSSILPNKDLFFSKAVKTNILGRPSGGLEFNANPQLSAVVILKTVNHINILCNNIHFIGVYYKPSLDFCDLLSDLQATLNVCSSPQIILGGDFNTHYDSSDFNSLSHMLSSHGLSLRSDPLSPTFHYKNGASTLDYVFASRCIIDLDCNILQRTESDHFPLKVSVKSCRNTSKIEKYSTSPQDILLNQSSRNLTTFQNWLPTCIYNHGSPEFSESISTFIDNSLSRRHKSTSSSNFKDKPWFTDLLRSLKLQLRKLFKNYIKSSTLTNKLEYQCAKVTYLKNCRLAKSTYRLNNIANLLLLAESSGIKSLYKTFKKKLIPSSAISLSSWQHYCTNLFNTLSQCPPSFHQMPHTAEAYDLLQSFSIEEIQSVLSSFRSKAKSFTGLSPLDLKKLSSEISAPLKLVFDTFLLNGHFPNSWLDLSLFFLHKKGSLSSPDNYRSIAIENPFLKTLTALLRNRFSKFTENNGFLPTFQFGFRQKYSAVGAVALLHECVRFQLSQPKGRLFTCFFDFRKAFDSVDRSILVNKLSALGFPHSLCLSLFNLLNNLNYRVRAGNTFSPPFQSTKGLPQGDPISPLLFNLFIHDLPLNLLHQGILLQGEFPIKFLQYADDLVLLSSSPDDLQLGIDSMAQYCMKNKLIVNTDKTECQVFYKGRIALPVFTYNDTVISNTNKFKYLGIYITTRLSSAPHTDHLISKASLRLSYLRSRFPLRDLPFVTVLNIFKVYILPIFTYGLHLWLPNISRSSETKLNSFFTKFLKHYLGIPYSSNNSITHFLTSTLPLSHLLKQYLSSSFLSLHFPQALSALKLQPPPYHPLVSPSFLLNTISDIPSWFWLSIPLFHFPTNKHSRRAICYDSLDLFHPFLCKTKKYHTSISDSCLCSFCSAPTAHFHHRTCNALSDLSINQISDFLTR